jgi:hypothetical protein
MDSDTLVDELIDSGRKLLEHLREKGFAFDAAAWLQASEDGRWIFYLVSPLVTSEGRSAAYGLLHPLVREMPQPFWIDPLEIRLIAADSPIATDLLAILRRTPGPRAVPVRGGGQRLGNLSVEGAYLYPLPSTAAA